MDKKQTVPYTITGTLGDGRGNVLVPNRDNYVYVRLAGSGIAEVFNNRVSVTYDLPVICGYDPTNPTKFQILSIQVMSSESVGFVGQGIGYAPASRYRWMYPAGGQDPLFVETRQIMPLRITPVGMKIKVHNQVIWNGSAWVVFGGVTETDLTSYIPTTNGKCLMALITIDNDGLIAVTAGDEVDIADLVVGDIPAPPENTRYILGAVRLYYGQTVIQEARTNTDIVDLRFLQKYPDTATPAAHTHVEADITDLDHDAVKIDGITVDLTGIANGQFIKYDAGTTSLIAGDTDEKSEHDAVKIGGIEVNLLNPQDGDSLIYNSGGAEALFNPAYLTKSGSVDTTNLFDGNKTNQWVSSAAVNWLKFNFPYSAYVSKIVITANAGDWMWADWPDDIYIYGSDTGEFLGEEIEMDHYQPVAEGVYTRTFAEPRTAYRYYRMTFGRVSHGCRINEIEIYTVPATHRIENQALVHDATKIDGITVDLTGISDGDALVYDLANTKIKPGVGAGSGDVVGPASSTDGHLAVFDGVDGKTIKDGGAIPTGASLTVEEADGTPSVADVIKIKVTNGSLTDDGSGVVSLDFGSAATDGGGGGTSGDWLEFIDGALVVETDVGGTYIVPRDSTIEAVMIHCKEQGSASSTIVDVNLNGTTIFTTQANRPELAYDDADGVAIGAPDVTDLTAGDVLTVDIDQVASGAESLSFIVAMIVNPTSIGSLDDVDLTGIVDGNVLVWDDVNSKFIVGEGGGGSGGADILEVQVFS
jgi:hypothetical protein